MSIQRTTRDKSMPGAQAIRRAAQVMRNVALLQRNGATLVAISNACELSTSTTFRILRTLTEEHLLSYDEVSKRYSVGRLTCELGLSSGLHEDVRKTWQPLLRQVAKRTQLSTHLFVRSDFEACCIACEEGTLPIRVMAVEVGARIPLGTGAGGLAILSTLGDEELKHVLKAAAVQLNGSEPVDWAQQQILASVLKARNDGFAIGIGAIANGIVEVGVPLRLNESTLQLSISVSDAGNDLAHDRARELAACINDAISEVREGKK